MSIPGILRPLLRTRENLEVDVRAIRNSKPSTVENYVSTVAKNEAAFTVGPIAGFGGAQVLDQLGQNYLGQAVDGFCAVMFGSAVGAKVAPARARSHAAQARLEALKGAHLAGASNLDKALHPIAYEQAILKAYFKLKPADRWALFAAHGENVAVVIGGAIALKLGTMAQNPWLADTLAQAYTAALSALGVDRFTESSQAKKDYLRARRLARQQVFALKSAQKLAERASKLEQKYQRDVAEKRPSAELKQTLASAKAARRQAAQFDRLARKLLDQHSTLSKQILAKDYEELRKKHAP